MKTIYKNLLCGLCGLIFFSACEEKDERTVFSHSTPVIENAALSALTQSDAIVAGDSVEFTAVVSDPTTPLSTIEVQIVMNDRLVVKEKLRTKDQNATVKAKYKIPFYADLEDGTYPEVHLKLENVEGDVTEMTLPNEKNVKVNRPVFGSKLYLVDEIEDKVYELNKASGSAYDYELPVGSYGKSKHFRIAEKLESDGKTIDYSGFVWAKVNDQLEIVYDQQNSAMTIEDPLILDIQQIHFNVQSFAYTFDANWYEAMTIGGQEFATSTEYSGYLKVEIALTQGEEYKISGFSNLQTVLNPDFFTYISNSKARFEGLTGTYSLYYKPTTGFMYVEQASTVYPDAMWICGTGLGFPQTTYASTTKWDWTQPADYVFCRKISNGVFQGTFYAASTYDMKFFHQRTWGGEELSSNYTVSPASLISATSGGNLGSPAGFTAGVYKVVIDVNAKTITMTKN
ncbi:MAG: DUF5016 domain-containing protein [Dysgonomonas sp.]